MKTLKIQIEIVFEDFECSDKKALEILQNQILNHAQVFIEEEIELIPKEIKKYELKWKY